MYTIVNDIEQMDKQDLVRGRGHSKKGKKRQWVKDIRRTVFYIGRWKSVML